MNKPNYFFSQPHQPFFVMGVINAILFMMLFMLSYKGVITFTTTPNLFHSYSLIFGVFTPFFLGFLLTTFPRFSQVPELEKSIYVTNFALLSSGLLLFLIGSLWSSILIYIGSFLVLGALVYTMVVFYQIYKASPMPELHDQQWIMVGFGSGIVSGLLFFIGFLTGSEIVFSLAKLIGIYLFLTITALSVGQRMIPFFSHVMIDKNLKLLPTVFALFALFIVFEVFELKIGFFFLFIAGIVLGKEIKIWKLPFQNSEPILWILHLAIFWLPISLILTGFASLAEIIFEKDFIYVGIHLVMLGFLTTVMIGFGTRVTLGHSGNNMVIDKRTKFLFYLTQIIVYFRALYSFSGSSIMFDITVTLWLILFIAWAVKYLPVLVVGKKIN
ncbi:MAG TPA: NnrS family protein [Campylobacterales bacterium]|nr:NnrS family protein [Campylobacterales bacterium]